MKSYDTASEQEGFILIGIENGESLMDSSESLDELEELVKTSGGFCHGRLTQKRDRPHPGTYLGKGKLAELSDLISLFGAVGIVCDDELSNTQIKNLSEALDVKIIDRTLLILDIFAKRAGSAEGKVQVELAQQKYRLSHLTGIGRSLSRLGGGIGTRGPGEKKLETDRRHIRRRISELEADLKEIQTHRSVQRDRRIRNSQPLISLVGYTNAGKSTLMNALTAAGVYESGELFATLDTTTRQMEFSAGSKALISDTVGFINKLPHNLIKAFRSTLDELKYSDIIIHVVDSSNPSRNRHMKVVYDTLLWLGCLDKPVLTVLNKSDLQVELPYPMDTNAVKTMFISAKTGDGIEELKTEIENILKSLHISLKALIPYSEGSLMNRVREKSELTHEEYRENGIYIELYADSEIEGRIKEYIIE